MKLKKQTIDILQNFATINSSLFIKATVDGETTTKIKTIDKEQTFIAEAVVDEIFPVDVCIADIGSLLNSIKGIGYDSYELDFSDKYLTISSTVNNAKVKLVYTDPAAIVTVTKSLALPSVDAEFNFKEEHMKNITGFSSLLALGNIKLTSTGDKLQMSAFDKKNPNTSSYKIDVSDAKLDEFDVLYSKSTMKFMESDYVVSVCLKGISKFESIAIPGLVYYIPHDRS